VVVVVAVYSHTWPVAVVVVVAWCHMWPAVDRLDAEMFAHNLVLEQHWVDIPAMKAAVAEQLVGRVQHLESTAPQTPMRVD
jgi:hypothetical protein